MNDGLERFNSLASEEAERGLRACFANAAWVAAVAAGRPYPDMSGVFAAADSAWEGMAREDWLAAFAAHPRIGERGGHAPRTSEREQSGVTSASPPTLAALAAENRQYELRFGHVFLISAQGRTADEVLDALRRRMSNDPDTELKIAAGEQRKITRLRLEGLLNQ